jgi:hypothetical protein
VQEALKRYSQYAIHITQLERRLTEIFLEFLDFLIKFSIIPNKIYIEHRIQNTGDRIQNIKGGDVQFMIYY